jgi:hypothetical protein
MKRCFKCSKGHVNSLSPFWVSKNNLDEFAKFMFQVGEWPWEIIICLLDVVKCNFGEVHESMVQMFEKHWELIFCLLDISNNTLSLPSNTAIYYKMPCIRVRSLQSFSITTCFGPSIWPSSGLYVSSEGDYITCVYTMGFHWVYISSIKM